MADASGKEFTTWIASWAKPVKDTLLSPEVGSAVGTAVAGEAGGKVGAAVLGGIGERTKQSVNPNAKTQEFFPVKIGQALVVPVAGREESIVVRGPADVIIALARHDYSLVDTAGRDDVEVDGVLYDLLSPERRRAIYAREKE